MRRAFEGRRGGWQNPNPIEGLQILLKMHVEDGNPSTEREHIDVMTATRQSHELVVASMRRMIRKLRDNLGNRLDH
jgi:hypothetical protein